MFISKGKAETITSHKVDYSTVVAAPAQRRSVKLYAKPKFLDKNPKIKRDHEFNHA